ncbi:hypothetical protein EBT31_07890 [bacterium]|nr:hypothetical protein [bacterium]
MLEILGMITPSGDRYQPELEVPPAQLDPTSRATALAAMRFVGIPRDGTLSHTAPLRIRGRSHIFYTPDFIVVAPPLTRAAHFLFIRHLLL